MSKFANELLKIPYITEDYRPKILDVLFRYKKISLIARLRAMCRIIRGKQIEIIGNFKRVNLYSYENFAKTRNAVIQCQDRFPQFKFTEIETSHIDTDEMSMDMLMFFVYEDDKTFSVMITCKRWINLERIPKKSNVELNNSLAFT